MQELKLFQVFKPFSKFIVYTIFNLIMETQSPKSFNYGYIDLLKCFSEPSAPLLNGYVAHWMYYSNDPSMEKTIGQLVALENLANKGDPIGFRKVSNAVRKLLSDIKRLEDPL